MVEDLLPVAGGLFDIGAHGRHQPRLAGIGQQDVEIAAQPAADIGIFDGTADLDAPALAAGHPVGRGGSRRRSGGAGAHFAPQIGEVLVAAVIDVGVAGDR